MEGSVLKPLLTAVVQVAGIPADTPVYEEYGPCLVREVMCDNYDCEYDA